MHSITHVIILFFVSTEGHMLIADFIKMECTYPFKIFMMIMIMIMIMMMMRREDN